MFFMIEKKERVKENSFLVSSRKQVTLLCLFSALVMLFSGCWMLPSDKKLYSNMESSAERVETYSGSFGSGEWTHGEIDGTPIYQVYYFEPDGYDYDYYYIQVDDAVDGSGRNDLDVVVSVSVGPIGDSFPVESLKDSAYGLNYLIELNDNNLYYPDTKVYIIFSGMEREEGTFSFRVYKTDTQL